MKRNSLRLLGGAVTLLAVSSAIASPLKVRSGGSKSQTTFMCADCKTKVTCAAVGDYILGLVVDQDNPKTGTGRLIVHVQDKDKKPVEGAGVAVTLSMPKHKHAQKPVTLKAGKAGEYVKSIQGLGMGGQWRADVSVTVNGDTVKQAFTFSK